MVVVGQEAREFSSRGTAAAYKGAPRMYAAVWRDACHVRYARAFVEWDSTNASRSRAHALAAQTTRPWGI